MGEGICFFVQQQPKQHFKHTIGVIKTTAAHPPMQERHALVNIPKAFAFSCRFLLAFVYPNAWGTLYHTQAKQ